MPNPLQHIAIRVDPRITDASHSKRLTSADRDALEKHYGTPKVGGAFYLYGKSIIVLPYCNDKRRVTSRTLTSLGVKSHRVPDGMLLYYQAANSIIFFDETINRFYAKDKTDATAFVESLDRRVERRLVYKKRASKSARWAEALLRIAKATLTPFPAAEEEVESITRHLKLRGLKQVDRLGLPGTFMYDEVADPTDDIAHVWHIKPQQGKCSTLALLKYPNPVTKGPFWVIIQGTKKYRIPTTNDVFHAIVQFVPKQSRAIMERVKSLFANVTVETRNSVQEALSGFEGSNEDKRKLTFALQVYAEYLRVKRDYGEPKSEYSDAYSQTWLAKNNYNRMLKNLDPKLNREFNKLKAKLKSVFGTAPTKQSPAPFAAAVRKLLTVAKALLQ